MPRFRILHTQPGTAATGRRKVEAPQRVELEAVAHTGVRRSTPAEYLQNRETVAQAADLYGSPQRTVGSPLVVAVAQATVGLAVMAAMAAQSSRV